MAAAGQRSTEWLTVKRQTANAKRDQASPLLVVYCPLFLQIN